MTFSCFVGLGQRGKRESNDGRRLLEECLNYRRRMDAVREDQWEVEVGGPLFHDFWSPASNGKGKRLPGWWERESGEEGRGIDDESVEGGGEREDGSVEGGREREDKSVEGGREREDESVEGRGEREDESVEGGRVREDESVEGRGEREDESVEGRGEREDESVEGRGEREDESIEGGREREDESVEGRGEREDESIEGGREREDESVEGRGEREDESIEGGREREDESVEGRGEREDESIEGGREREDESIEGGREREDESIEGGRERDERSEAVSCDVEENSFTGFEGRLAGLHEMLKEKCDFELALNLNEDSGDWWGGNCESADVAENENSDADSTKYDWSLLKMNPLGSFQDSKVLDRGNCQQISTCFSPKLTQKNGDARLNQNESDTPKRSTCVSPSTEGLLAFWGLHTFQWPLTKDYENSPLEKAEKGGTFCEEETCKMMTTCQIEETRECSQSDVCVTWRTECQSEGEESDGERRVILEAEKSTQKRRSLLDCCGFSWKVAEV